MTILPRMSPEVLNESLLLVQRWRASSEALLHCPVCAAPGVEIIDRSVRPYSEWYALRCDGCGLEASLHIPLPGPAIY